MLGDISGPHNANVATCLGRMVNWCKLVEAVLQAEIPYSDLLLQFMAFHFRRGLALKPRHARPRADFI